MNISNINSNATVSVLGQLRDSLNNGCLSLAGSSCTDILVASGVANHFFKMVSLGALIINLSSTSSEFLSARSARIWYKLSTTGLALIHFVNFARSFMEETNETTGTRAMEVGLGTAHLLFLLAIRKGLNEQMKREQVESILLKYPTYTAIKALAGKIDSYDKAKCSTDAALRSTHRAYRAAVPLLTTLREQIVAETQDTQDYITNLASRFSTGCALFESHHNKQLRDYFIKVCIQTTFPEIHQAAKTFRDLVGKVNIQIGQMHIQENTLKVYNTTYSTLLERLTTALADLKHGQDTHTKLEAFQQGIVNENKKLVASYQAMIEKTRASQPILQPAQSVDHLISPNTDPQQNYTPLDNNPHQPYQSQPTSVAQQDIGPQQGQVQQF